MDDLEDTAEVELTKPTDEAVAGAAAGETVEAAAGATADAASSTATDGSKTDGSDTLSVVRDVVGKRGSDPAAASSAKAEEGGGDPDASTTPKDGDDDYSDVPFNKHPRFQKLLREHGEFKQDAQRYRNVQGFLDREGLSGEDAAQGLTLLARSRNEGLTGDEMADGLRLMALAKTDPAAAWNGGLKEWVQKVVVAAGEWLPDDLRQRVQSGELSQDAAIELSRLRAQAQSQQSRQTFQQQQAKAREQQEHAKALRDTAEAWQADRVAKDPNFAAKLPSITEEVKKLQSMGWVPTTPDGVREQLRRAYSAVNGGARNSSPASQAQPTTARPAVKPVMGGQVAANTGTKPESTMDHVRAVLARRRAG